MVKSKSYLKRALYLILALIMLAPALASCKTGGGDNQKPAETPAQDHDGRTAEEDAADKGPQLYKADYLPDANYGGYVFRMVAIDEISGGVSIENGTRSADVEEERGETIWDALYKRNRIIEAKYNIKFKEIAVSSHDQFNSTFNKSVKAASDDFDLCMLYCRDAFSYALAGSVVPVSDLPYVDVSQPWYAQKVNSDMTIGGKMYLAYSDECLNMFESSAIICFNKDIGKELGLESVYTLVNEGKWTFDRFFDMARAAAKDMDGDGVVSSDRDRYGIVTEGDMFYTVFWIAGGEKIIGKDENDYPVFVGDNPRMYNVLEKAWDNIHGGGSKIIFDAFADNVTSYQRNGANDRFGTLPMWANSISLFYATYVGFLPYMREMEIDIGIAPWPKYDENQKEYYTNTYDGWIFTVPVTTEDPERTSIILEALAVESKNYTLPAYYEVALKNKYLRDEDSEKMLDLIRETRTMDMGRTAFLSMTQTYESMLKKSGGKEFASSIEKALGSIEKTLEKAIDQAEKLN